METIHHASDGRFHEHLSQLCDQVLVVTVELRSGEAVSAVLGFHDDHTLIYERWDPDRAAPSGIFGAVAIEDVASIVVY